MKFDLVKNSKGYFQPSYPSDDDKAAKIGVGEIVECQVWKERHYGHHKKFFALMNMAFENQGIYKDFDTYRKLLIMKAGYFDVVKTEKGTMYWPKSISFKSMSQDKFTELYDAMLPVIEQEIQISKETIETNLQDFY